MKRIIVSAVLTMLAISFSLSQVKQNNADEATLIAQEKQAIEAWKNKDTRFFEATMLDGFFFLDYRAGVVTKAQFVKDLPNSNCTVKSYSLDHTKVTMLNNDTALLTYRVTQDVSCGGKPEPNQAWASTIYVKRNGKWLGAFHQAAPAAQ